MATAKIDETVATRSFGSDGAAIAGEFRETDETERSGDEQPEAGQERRPRRHGRRASADEVGDRRHHRRADEGAHDAAEQDVADDLADPRRVQHDQQHGERAPRCRMCRGNAETEHEHSDPWRPVAELLTADGRAPVTTSTPTASTPGEDAEREQGELNRTSDEPTRAGHDLAGGQLEHGGRQRRARKEDDERGDDGPSAGSIRSWRTAVAASTDTRNDGENGKQHPEVRSGRRERCGARPPTSPNTAEAITSLGWDAGSDTARP